MSSLSSANDNALRVCFNKSIILVALWLDLLKEEQLFGKIITKTALPEGSGGVNPSLLVPGANNDVFLGTRSGVVRLYV